ncbi:HNH endonuclease, partial [Mycolicibacterium austroafricanum]
MFDIDVGASEAELRAAVERFERLKSQAAAAQARATALWAAKRRAAEQARGVPAAKRGKGLASEVALARHDAPVLGNRHLGFAKALVQEMPHTLAALECGALSEWRATLIVRESACLSVQHRRALDAELCGDVSRLAGWGNKRVEAEAKTIAARLDAAAVVDHTEKAAADCAVTCRPAPNNMVYVT